MLIGSPASTGLFSGCGWICERRCIVTKQRLAEFVLLLLKPEFVPSLTSDLHLFE